MPKNSSDRRVAGIGFSPMRPIHLAWMTLSCFVVRSACAVRSAVTASNSDLPTETTSIGRLAVTVAEAVFPPVRP